MVRVQRLAGWSMAMTRWHDETGTFHLMAVGEEGLVGPVCGSRAFSFSNAAHDEPPYGHICRTCAKARRRLGEASPGTGGEPALARFAGLADLADALAVQVVALADWLA